MISHFNENNGGKHRPVQWLPVGLVNTTLYLHHDSSTWPTLLLQVSYDDDDDTDDGSGRASLL